jgi:hypothetical protein
VHGHTPAGARAVRPRRSGELGEPRQIRATALPLQSPICSLSDQGFRPKHEVGGPHLEAGRQGEQLIEARIQPSRLEGFDALRLEAASGRQLSGTEASFDPDLSDCLPQGAQISLLLLLLRNEKPPKLR